MTITREQIDTIIRDKIELECYDWDRYRVVGQTEAVDEIMALITTERNAVIDQNEKAQRDEQARLKFLFG